jgi:hypothetical protein
LDDLFVWPSWFGWLLAWFSWVVGLLGFLVWAGWYCWLHDLVGSVG